MKPLRHLLRNICLVVSLTLLLTVPAMGGIIEGGYTEPPPQSGDNTTVQNNGSSSAVNTATTSELSVTEQLLLLADTVLSVSGII